VSNANSGEPLAGMSATDIADRLPLDTLADALTEQGWWVGDHAIPRTLTDRLRAEIARLDDEDRLRRAGIGRETDYQVDRDIRRDRIRWLNRESAVQAELLDIIAALKDRLNRSLFLGLFEFEGHFALYPEGAFYRTHYDSFRGAANRVVSLVLFLNPEWRPEHGGELVLYTDDETTERARIAPLDGRLVLFLSEEIPHEVRPTRAPRRSVAGWYRLNTSIGGQIDPPR
jgi:SM-20-related protein